MYPGLFCRRTVSQSPVRLGCPPPRTAPATMGSYTRNFGRRRSPTVKVRIWAQSVRERRHSCLRSPRRNLHYSNVATRYNLALTESFCPDQETRKHGRELESRRPHRDNGRCLGLWSPLSCRFLSVFQGGKPHAARRSDLIPPRVTRGLSAMCGLAQNQ